MQHNHRFLVLGALAAALIALAAIAPQITIRYAVRPQYTQEIFHAVLEGLYRDGVSNDAVDAITAIDPKTGYPANFVYACPVCMPVLSALFVYRARPKFYGDKLGRDTFGDGLGSTVETALASSDLEVRQTAICELVERWIGRRVEMQRPTDAEREEWADEMSKRREEGASYLESYRAAGWKGAITVMKKCPSCEAANGACEKR